MLNILNIKQGKYFAVKTILYIWNSTAERSCSLGSIMFKGNNNSLGNMFMLQYTLLKNKTKNKLQFKYWNKHGPFQ